VGPGLEANVRRVADRDSAAAPGGAPSALTDARVSLERFLDDEGFLLDPPEDIEPIAWIERARDAARAVAEAGGLTFDLDPNVETRLDELRVDAARERRLAQLDDRDLAHIREKLGFRLHPYQDDGLRFLARRGRAFLADDMGLGKTIQAIAAALVLRESAAAPRCLVVCPASLKYQWQAEIRRAWGEEAAVVEGRRALRSEDYRAWTSGFLILNYELVLRDLDLIRAVEPDLIVLDEAHRIKNWDTKTAKAVKQLQSPFSLILTGTPLENRLSELHSLVEFLHPRALGPRWRLLPYHAVSDPTGRVLGYEDLQVLRRRLKPFFLRRERGAVLDQLPAKTDNTFWTEMTPGQMRPYRRLAARVAKLLSSGHALGPAEVRSLLQALTSMRVLCNGLAQYHWDRFEPVVRAGVPEGEEPDLKALRSPKLEEFVDVLEDLLEQSETKIVVFSQWERMLNLARYAMSALLRRRGERTAVFHGGLDARSRARMLEAFRTDPGFRVLLSTDAGGLGLNLQEAASVVVNLEVPWNPAVLEQRIARVHRLGQRRSVQVLHFVTKSAIEERVRKVVESKRQLFDGLLVEGRDEVTFGETGRAGFVEQVRSLIDRDGENVG
jgi:SNF2 family DNA or RNA helicase